MALTTIETQMINKSSPISNQYSLGNRLQQMTTKGMYGTVTTAGSSNTTASVEADFHGPHGIVYETGSGYYTLAQPVAGCHLLWFHGGATDQFIRSRQAGSGATGPSFHYGTGTTYACIETTKQAGMALDFYGLSSEVWLVGSHTSDDALLGLATSS
jgi:hypothetical protein